MAKCTRKMVNATIERRVKERCAQGQGASYKPGFNKIYKKERPLACLKYTSFGQILNQSQSDIC